MPRQKTVSSGVVSRTRRPKQPEGKAGVARHDDGIAAEVFGEDPASEMVPATDEPITPVSRAGLRNTDLNADDADRDDGDEEESDDDEEEGGGALGAILMIILAPIAAMLIQMAISRSREYSADAASAKYTGHPDFLIGAHAAVVGATLLTRDPERVRSYFPTVALLLP